MSQDVVIQVVHYRESIDCSRWLHLFYVEVLNVEDSLEATVVGLENFWQFVLVVCRAYGRYVQIVVPEWAEGEDSRLYS